MLVAEKQAFTFDTLSLGHPYIPYIDNVGKVHLCSCSFLFTVWLRVQSTVLLLVRGSIRYKCGRLLELNIMHSITLIDSLVVRVRIRRGCLVQILLG